MIIYDAAFPAEVENVFSVSMRFCWNSYSFSSFVMKDIFQVWSDDICLPESEDQEKWTLFCIIVIVKSGDFWDENWWENSTTEDLFWGCIKCPRSSSIDNPNAEASSGKINYLPVLQNVEN